MLTLAFALTIITLCNAQKIETQKVFGGYKYTQDGNQLSFNDLVKTMESNQEAYDLMKKAKSNNTLASIVGGMGGGFLGWSLGSAIGGGDFNLTIAGIGAAFIAIGIPISSGVNRKAKQAIDLYNASLSSTSFRETNPEYKLILSGNTIGVAMKF